MCWFCLLPSWCICVYLVYIPLPDVLETIPALETAVADFQKVSATAYLHKAALLLVYRKHTHTHTATTILHLLPANMFVFVCVDRRWCMRELARRRRWKR